MTFDTTDPTYQELRARVLSGRSRVVPFVGAGLSVYGEPAGRLPAWRELIDRLIAHGQLLGLIDEHGDPAITQAITTGRYIEAMDRLLGSLGEPTFKRLVERELDERDKPTPPAIAELVAIGWSLIVTTNLDRLIARAYLERHGRPMDAFTSLDTHRLAAALAGTLSSQETLLAQIHGAVDMYPSWRLTRAHYEQLLQQPGYVEALKQLFLRQVFFVGFGLQDDDLDLLLSTVAEIYPAGVGEFYALIARPRRDDPVVQHLIRTNGLRPIFYDVDPSPDPNDPFGGHREVFDCLQDLAAAWAAADHSFEVTLKYFPELDPYVIGRETESAELLQLVTRRAGGVVQVLGLGGVGKTSFVQRVLTDHRPELARAGYGFAFGCSFYRADIGQFIQDLALTIAAPSTLPLPQQVERIAAHLRAHRTVLVLDGLEALLDTERQLRTPALQQIIDAVLQGRGTVVATSRTPIAGGLFEHATVIELQALSGSDIISFLDNWGLDRLGDLATRRLVEITAGHPLALRILAGLLSNVRPADAVLTIEQSAVINVADPIDPLRENRLARIFSSYLHHLEPDAIAFLTTFTVFDQPVSYSLVTGTLARAYPDTNANEELVATDLRPLIVELIRQRLLTVSAVGELSSHPTVREYFASHARSSEKNLAPLHRHLAREYLRGGAELPATFTEAQPLLAACRQAAACEDWTLFDDTFRRRLMQDHLAHLCDYLGAWDEALTVARLGDGSSFPAQQIRDPAFYPLIVARCLKHLGRSAESRSKYLDGLALAAGSRDPETAMYVNNFLTLLLWRGELDAADMLAELNLRALSWITDDWRRRWQIEHGCSSIAYLKLQQGQLDAASALFEHSAHAWDDYPEERVWVWDYYPFYRSELILLEDPSAHQAALQAIEPLMSICESRDWPEPRCRGHIQIASIFLDRARRERDPAALTQADQHLDVARQIPNAMIVPDVEIEFQLTSVKTELVRRGLQPDRPLAVAEIDGMLKRAANLIEVSELRLAEPQLIAGRALLDLELGSPANAEAGWRRAIAECERQGNRLAASSPRSLVFWLGELFDHSPGLASGKPGPDLRPAIGSELTAEWMIERLAEVRAHGDGH